jgi:hypothetical protein
MSGGVGVEPTQPPSVRHWSVTTSLLIKQKATCILQQSMYVYNLCNFSHLTGLRVCFNATAYRFIVAELIMLEIVTEWFNTLGNKKKPVVPFGRV